MHTELTLLESRGSFTDFRGTDCGPHHWLAMYWSIVVFDARHGRPARQASWLNGSAQGPPASLYASAVQMLRIFSQAKDVLGGPSGWNGPVGGGQATTAAPRRVVS
jgi:hypothetical protein